MGTSDSFTGLLFMRSQRRRIRGVTILELLVVISLIMKQMFQATSDALDKRMRKLWEDSVQIAAISYVAADGLAADLQRNGEHYTPWLKLEWQALNGDFKLQLANYINP